MTRVKICGLSTTGSVEASLRAGADLVGFVTFPRSPRHVTPASAARLAAPARGRAQVVSVLVDPDDALLEEVSRELSPDLIQLHGAETPSRVEQVRRLTGARVIKALAVNGAEDLNAAGAYAEIADHLMFDARPPAGADLPGGVGVRFDWRLLVGRTLPQGWFLAGGLRPDDVAEALALTAAPAVDVSSGVEAAPGLKDPARIAAFLQAVRAAAPSAPSRTATPP